MAAAILAEVGSLRDLAAQGSPEERKLFIRAFVEGLTLYPDERRGELKMKEVPTPGGAGTSFEAIAGACLEQRAQIESLLYKEFDITERVRCADATDWKATR